MDAIAAPPISLKVILDSSAFLIISRALLINLVRSIVIPKHLSYLTLEYKIIFMIIISKLYLTLQR